MGKTIKKIRFCLKKNEVFFTTACALALSFMGIMVSIKSWQIAKRQYQMEYFEKYADWQIEEHQILNNETQYYDENELAISKLSGKAKNINIDIICFLDIKITDKNNMQFEKRYDLLNFYDTNFLTGTNDGKIQTSTGYKNNARLVDFEKALQSELEDNYQFVETVRKTILKISYLNFLNENVNEYYSIEKYNGWLIKDTIQGSKFFKEYDEKFGSQNSIKLNELEKMNVKEITKNIVTTANRR